MKFTDLERLKAVTHDCRDDMHEPDEQGVSARVVGYVLDNAHGEEVRVDAIIDGWQELVVVLERDGLLHQFNLAMLIALARKAVLTPEDPNP